MENLGIDYKLLIAQLVNFAVFFLVFQRFIAKPFLAYLNKQKKEEEERSKLLTELQHGEETLQAREKELVQKMKKETEKVLEQAKKDAEKVKEEIIAQAHKEADAVVAKAKEQLEEERNVLYKEVKNQVANLSSVLVTKALKSYLTPDAQKQVTEHILTHLPKELNS
jgi:F-type H+-transporting ATPase subunit b